MYAGSRPRASQMFSKPNGQSVADAANHSSDSVNKRCPRRVEEVTYFWKVPTASTRRGQRRSEEHTSELQSLAYLVCRLLLEKKKKPHVTDYRPITAVAA